MRFREVILSGAGASACQPIAVSLLLLFSAFPLLALEKVAADPLELQLTVGKGMVVDCPKGVKRVAISSPEIVDVVAASTEEVLLHAKALGQATVFIWSKLGDRLVYNV